MKCYSLGHKLTISIPRLHPVAVSLQRYIAEDIIIQNYHIPSGVSSNLEVPNLLITTHLLWISGTMFFRPWSS